MRMIEEFMDNVAAHDERSLLLEALEQLRSALSLLDDGNAPSQIGAHVDLAIHQLSIALASNPACRLSVKQEA